MKIDLCKLFGVEEGEEFKRFKDGSTYRIKENVLQFFSEYYNMWSESSMYINDINDYEIIKLPKKKSFSQDTLNFFKMIDKKWEWIAKDEDGLVCLYDTKTSRNSFGRWFNHYGWCCVSDINQSLFDPIHWEDEPIRIDDYVER